jgi:hypothetical protein
MATNSSKYKLTGVNGSEIQISLNGPTGPTGPANVLEIGDVTTAETSVPAAASITGSSPSQLLHLTLPKGNTGTAATISAGTTTTGAAGSSASVTNGGSSSAAVFNFTIPKGDKGNTGTLSLGTFATGNAGTDVIITNTGTPEAGEFNFTIPRGNTGATGTAATIAVGATSTGAAGSSALVTNVGTSSAAVFDFTIPRGNTGATGTAATIAVGTTTTGAAGSSALVTNVGTSSAAVFDFTIPQGLQGIQGIQGETGSSGATALLTGYVSGAGTVAATDTVIQAVGKLNGNDELKAPIASLYPYIGGKLLTYLDEEAAIADPLISAGDIYRKSAGGVDYVNPDNVPSLDLRFATDKTLTARRGPTPTFSRASSGTFVNANGLIVGKTAGTTSSITPNTQAIGSQVTVTVASGSVVGWVVGQAISLIVDTDGQDDPDATELWLLGNIVSTTDTTLVFSVTSRTAQAGSATSWTLGYRGPRFDHDPVSRTNLLSRSAEFNETAWLKLRSSISANSTASPSGDGSADKLVEDASNNTHMVYRLFNTGSLVAHTFSVFAKADGRNFVYLDCGDGFPLNSNAYFDLSNGTLGTIGANATATITAFGNGWYRCSVTATPTSTTTNGFYIQTASANGTKSYQGDGASGIFIWGAQLEAGSTTTSYIPTTTASVTIHDCRGLLIEEGRTNLFSSTNLNDWSASRVTRTAITGIGLTNQATTLTRSEIGSSYIFRGATLTTGVAYAISLRVKAGTAPSFTISDFTDSKFSRLFNLSTSQWPASGGSVEFTNYSVTPNVDGWFLVSVIYTPTGATGAKNIVFEFQGVVGDTVSFDTPQLEVGSFPTSYIPTTTGSVVRSADVCNITGANFTSFYNQSEGTLFADVTPQSIAQLATVLAVNSGSSQNQHGIYKTNAALTAAGLRWGATSVLTGFVTQAAIVTGTDVAISRSKLSYAYKLDDFSFAYAGTIVGTDTSGTLPSPTTMQIGNRDGALQINGHLASIRYYKKRLPNAKLQALTV